MQKLGTEVKDTITGFEGIVTGRVEYLTGCVQYFISPKISADGAFREGVWIDEVRLKCVNDTKIILDKEQVKKEPAGPQKNNPTFNLPK